MHTGDSCAGKSAIVQSFHSDGTHYPKNYTMVIIRYIISVLEWIYYLFRQQE